jgi:hypothetical protein
MPARLAMLSLVLAATAAPAQADRRHGETPGVEPTSPSDNVEDAGRARVNAATRRLHLRLDVKPLVVQTADGFELRRTVAVSTRVAQVGRLELRLGLSRGILRDEVPVTLRFAGEHPELGGLVTLELAPAVSR